MVTSIKSKESLWRERGKAKSAGVKKVAVASNKFDVKGLSNVCPKEGMILTDKAYSRNDDWIAMKANIYFYN